MVTIQDVRIPTKEFAANLSGLFPCYNIGASSAGKCDGGLAAAGGIITITHPDLTKDYSITHTTVAQGAILHSAFVPKDHKPLEAFHIFNIYLDASDPANWIITTVLLQDLF